MRPFVADLERELPSDGDRTESWSRGCP